MAQSDTDADDRGLEQLRTRRDALDAAITQIEAENAAAERTARDADQHQAAVDYIRTRWQRSCEEGQA